MEKMVLKSSIREGIGKKATHKIRAGGKIPAVLYGHGREPITLAVNEKELWYFIHNATSEHLILKVEIDGSDEKDITALVRDVQHHPVTGDILHVDLQRISLDEKIKVGVPVQLMGQSKAVKEFGGILDHGVREVNIRCKPSEIPEAFHIDVSHLEIGQSCHISDIVADYPQLEFLDDGNVTLAHVSPPKKKEAAEEAAAEKVGEEAAEAEEKAGGEEEV